MKPRYSLLFVLTVIVGQSSLLAQGCTDGTTYISGVSYAISRPSDNTVRYITETSITGNYRYYWRSYITSWMYRNGLQISNQPESTPTNLGEVATHTYNMALSSYGPGTYAGTGYHRAYTPYCLYWYTFPPGPGGQNGYTSAPQLTISRPTVSMDHPIWYLGGQGGFGSYQTAGVLTAAGNGATSTPSWVIVFGSQKIQLSCSTCLQAYVTALQASNGCSYDVIVRASFGGFQSDDFYIFIDRPHRFDYVNGNNTSFDSPYGNGFQSTVSYALKGMCGAFLTDMRGGEWFPNTGYGVQDQANNWPPGNPATLTNPSAVWTDTMRLTNCTWVQNQCYPDGMNPQNPRLTNSIRRVDQHWWMGSLSFATGARVQTDQIQLFQDHARHISISSPAP